MAEQNYTLGIDLGGTKILAAVVDQKGQIYSRAKKKTRADLGLGTVLGRILKVAHEAIEQSGINPKRIGTLGIGTPGPVDSQTGLVLEAPNLGFKNLNLKAYLEEQMGMPSFVFNDVNAGTWGEYVMGAGHGYGSCLGVFVGTGIGGGIVLNHKLYEGAGRFAGEIGHICISIHGPLCGCGRHGCLEAFASRTAMTRDIWKAIGKGTKSSLLTVVGKKKGGQIRSGQLKEAYDKKDKVVCRAINHAADYLGIGLGAAASLLNPACIVLGGGVVTALGEPYLARVRKAFEVHTLRGIYESTHLVQATLGDDAGILGAALLAMKRRPAAKG